PANDSSASLRSPRGVVRERKLSSCCRDPVAMMFFSRSIRDVFCLLPRVCGAGELVCARLACVFQGQWALPGLNHGLRRAAYSAASTHILCIMTVERRKRQRCMVMARRQVVRMLIMTGAACSFARVMEATPNVVCRRSSGNPARIVIGSPRCLSVHRIGYAYNFRTAWTLAAWRSFRYRTAREALADDRHRRGAFSDHHAQSGSAALV